MQASPSKARAHAIESQAWSLITAWLTQLCSPAPVPNFERNTITLRAFQALMAENHAADKVQESLFNAKCEELENSRHECHEGWAAGDVASMRGAEDLACSLEASLSDNAKTALDSLASSAVLLGCCSLSSTSSDTGSCLQSLRSRGMELSQQTYALEEHISSIDALISNLRFQIAQTERGLSNLGVENASQSPSCILDDHHKNLRSSTPEIQSPMAETEADHSHLYAETLQHQRETQQLQLKSTEYQSRIVALERHLSSSQSSSLGMVSTTDLVSRRRLLEEKKKRVEQLEADFKSFQGLPPDINASRSEARRMQEELDALRRKRDGMFEMM